MRREKVNVIIIEPYYNFKIAESVAKDAGAKVLILPVSVGGVKGIDTYLDMLEYNISKLVEALGR